VADSLVQYRCVLRSIELVDANRYQLTFEASRVDLEARQVVAETPMSEPVVMICELVGDADKRFVGAFRAASHLDPAISMMDVYGDADSVRSVVAAVMALDRARRFAARDDHET